jgi:hypothetical protein
MGISIDWDDYFDILFLEFRLLSEPLGNALLNPR